MSIGAELNVIRSIFC